MDRRNFALSTLAGALSSYLPSAMAQSWPEKPIKLWVSQPAGSSPDTMARMIGDQLSRRWNQPIVVDNRPGGQNTIGTMAAAKSTPDGYSFFFTTASLVTNAYLMKSLPYDPRKDFVPVGMVGKSPFAISVNADSKLKSMADLVAYAKANPGKLAIANEGPNTFGGMMTRLLASQLGIQINAVPYVSSSKAVLDTVAGQIEVIFSPVISVTQMASAGKLRPLGVTTAKRVVGWETVPAIAETVPGFDFAGWIAVVAPAGTPAAAIQRFNRDLDAVLTDKEFAARLLTMGPITEGAGTPDQMKTFLEEEHTRWAKLAKEIGVLPE